MTPIGPITAEDSRLLARAAAWHAAGDEPADLTTEWLAELARAHGLDFATAVWYDGTARVPANAAFLRRLCTPPADGAPLPDLIGIVPGAFHRDHAHTGADGARIVDIARELRCAAEVVPVGAFGTLDDNARVLCEWLATRAGRRIVLVSLSKGGADVKRALGLPAAAGVFADVAAWLNFSGIVHGTPLVEWLRRRPLRWLGVRLLLWWRGHAVSPLDELARAAPASCAAWPVLPAHLRVVHVYGAPLQRHLAHPWANRAYRRLAGLGPNDGGGVLLGGLVGLPGILCPVWGADHYLSPAWDLTPFLRHLVGSILADDPEVRQTSQSAAAPSTAPAARSTT